MLPSVNVLVYGPLDAGSCDIYRAGMYRDHLAALGVTLRPWTQLSVDFAPGYAGRPMDAVRDGAFEIDRTDLNWADVIVFRRFYFTAFACESGDAGSLSEAEIAEHARVSGHPYRRPRELLLRPMWARYMADPRFFGDKAIVYETDDDILATPDWYGRAVVAPEFDLVSSLMRRADLVTVSTPQLEQSCRRFNKAVQVIRNAIEPSWYPDPDQVLDRDGEPRILYYGVSQRLRDYAICRDSVDELVGGMPGARRVWVGSEDEAVRNAVDEVVGFVRGPERFAGALVEARPHIGLAPVVDEPYNRARSELHWLEYAMAGAPTVASRLPGAGPYSMIRNGVDGLLVHGKLEWRQALRSLARSPQRRAEIAGRARERVLAEYRAVDRAQEWAAAYRWAAEHAGSGLARRSA